MKHLPIGYQNFKEIVEENFVYVDKTQQIHELLARGKLYFFSRPRRFGKSLLVSTLAYIFKGEKALFKGLYIYEKTNWKWQIFPVLQFNFASYGYKEENLELELKDTLNDFAETYEITLPNRGVDRQFKVLVEKIALKYSKVVILIDEYDKPIVDFLTEPAKADKNRIVLKQLFAPLKNMDSQSYLKFLFITGVSKFTIPILRDVFSDLNNLTDLTLNPFAKDLVGVTDEEIQQYFPKYIQEAASKFKISETALLAKIKFWYDGYSWNGKTFLYNPFSLLNFFSTKQFKQFWFATGTPTFLIEQIRQQKVKLEKLETKFVSDEFFEKFDIDNLNRYLYHLLFQTGYLTIKSVENFGDTDHFQLGYPNQEVRKAFLHNLLEAYTFQPSDPEASG